MILFKVVFVVQLRYGEKVFRGGEVHVNPKVYTRLKTAPYAKVHSHQYSFDHQTAYTIDRLGRFVIL